MPNLPDVTTWAVPAFLFLLAVEWLSFRLHPDDDEVGYQGKDTATSLAMGLGSVAWDLLWRLPVLPIYIGLFELTPVRWEFAWWQVPLILVVQDLCYYWSHRLHHTVRVLWAAHVVHHSSQRFNLSTALRQSWTAGLTTWIFYVPLIALGVAPAVLFFVQGLNLIYQFWIHTERIGRLPRLVEAVFNTPSHHRVHHASNGSYLDRNFAGVLIVWDRLFGTFEPERETCAYGLTKNIRTYNPLRVAYHEYAAIGRDLRQASGWRESIGYLVRSPGWVPDNDRSPRDDR